MNSGSRYSKSESAGKELVGLTDLFTDPTVIDRTNKAGLFLRSLYQLGKPEEAEILKQIDLRLSQKGLSFNFFKGNTAPSSIVEPLFNDICDLPEDQRIEAIDKMIEALDNY